MSKSGTERKLLCAYCPEKTFTTETTESTEAYIKHLKCHVIGDPFRCSKCGDVFDNSLDFNTHICTCFEGIEFGTGTYAAAALPPIVPPEQSQFVCEDCKINLNNQAAYTEHRGRHGPRGRFKCGKCGIEFGNSFVFNRHISRCYAGIKPPEQSQFVCEDCQIDLNDQAAYTEHRGRHGPGGRFKCGNCGYSFRTPYGFTDHILRCYAEAETSNKIKTGIKRTSTSTAAAPSVKIAPPKQSRFVCEKCEIDFNDQVTYTEHRACHGPGGPFVCNNCGVVLDNSLDFNNHISGCHAVAEAGSSNRMNVDENPESGTGTVERQWFTIPTMDDYVKHARRETDEPYTCINCNEVFASKDFQDYVYHGYKCGRPPGQENVTYICIYCDLNLPIFGDLLRHYEYHGPKEEPFTCKLCEGVCGNSKFFNEHIDGCHGTPGIHRYLIPCRICGERLFTDVDDYNRHFGFHVDGAAPGAPFKCRRCGKDFNYKDHFAWHIATHMAFDDRMAQTGQQPQTFQP